MLTPINLRRRVTLLVNPFDVKPSAVPLWRSVRAGSLPVRQRADGKLEALDNAALMKLWDAWRSVAVAALYDEIDGDEIGGLFVPRFRDDGHGYLFKRALVLSTDVQFR